MSLALLRKSVPLIRLFTREDLIALRVVCWRHVNGGRYKAASSQALLKRVIDECNEALGD